MNLYIDLILCKDVCEPVLLTLFLCKDVCEPVY